MILFSINCPSCAARLNVSKESAVGQILGCPKCGTMIEIQPPPGWDPPPGWGSTSVAGHEKSISPTAPDADDAAQTVGSNFDDIDSLLDSTDAQQDAIRQIRKHPAADRPLGLPLPKPTQSKSNQSKQKPQPEKRSANQHETTEPATNKAFSEPILPTNQWVSAETQKRRKLTAGVVIGIGVILLGLAGYTALRHDASATPDVAEVDNASPEALDREVKQGPDDPIVDQPADDARDPPTLADPDLESPNAADLNPTVSPETTTEPSTNPAPTATVEPDIKSNLDPPPLVPGNRPPMISNAAPPILSSENSVVPIQSLPPSIAGPEKTTSDVLPRDTPPDETNANSPQSQLSDLATVETEIGKLSALLEQSGTSILKIKDLAESNRERQLIGLPRYFIERPDFEIPDVEKQLSLPCAAMRYSDSRLVNILDDISSITGLPITLDAESMLAVGIDWDAKVNVDLQGNDFGQAIEAIVQPLGLGMRYSRVGNTPSGIVIGVASPDSFVEKSYALPEFLSSEGQAEETAIASLGSVIQSLFAPNSWTQDPGPATLSILDGRLTVSNTIQVQAQIERLLAKLSICAELAKADSLNADRQGKLILDTRWQSLADSLLQPPGLKMSPDQPIADFLRTIYENTGVTVLVDWDSVISQGWSPATEIPGTMNEPTLGAVLKETARSMKLTYRAVDETTIELTTFEKAAATPELEVYFLGQILAGRLNEEQTQRLIVEAMGAQLQAPHVRFVYEPTSQCLIFSAPQSVQRQIASVLQRLENL